MLLNNSKATTTQTPAPTAVLTALHTVAASGSHAHFVNCQMQRNSAATCWQPPGRPCHWPAFERLVQRSLNGPKSKDTS
jgi:hypothetical protein